MTNYEEGYANGWDEGYDDGVVEGKRLELEAVLAFIVEQGDGLSLLESLRRGDHHK